MSADPRSDADVEASTVESLDIVQATDADQLEEHQTAVMVDVLRASTTIAVALDRGASKVVPVQTPEAAREACEKLPDAIACGERSRGALEGFVDNSPAKLAALELEGRAVVLTTTNGTRALLACKDAGRVLVGCMANAHALRRAVAGEDVALVAAGWRDEPAEDDDACCAFLAELLTGGDPDEEAALDALEASTSARKLREHGKGDDVDLCLAIDRFPVVPELDGRSLVPAGGQR